MFRLVTLHVKKNNNYQIISNQLQSSEYFFMRQPTPIVTKLDHLAPCHYRWPIIVQASGHTFNTRYHMFRHNTAVFLYVHIQPKQVFL